MGRDFKVGDIIKGTCRAGDKYNITDSRMAEARVIDTDCVGGEIQIEVLEHRLESQTGQEFVVDPEYFDFVRHEGGSEMSRDFKVGDRVRIRAWDDMEKEYGLNELMNIKCKKTFTSGMKNLCGRTATISETREDGVVNLCDWDDSSGDIAWQFSTDMLELADDSKMAQVARILGVELGEEFHIEGHGYNPYELTKDGLFDRDGDQRIYPLWDLLIGKYKIIRPTCAHCGGTNEVVQQGDAAICKQCAKDALAG